MNAPELKTRVSWPGLILLLALLTLVGACSKKSTDSGTQQPEPTEQSASTGKQDSISYNITQLRQRFQQGIDALATSDYTQARRIFEDILSSNPGLSGPQANLALIDFHQQKYDQSFERVNRAIDLNPSNAQSYNLRAQLHLQKGEINLARQDYQQAIELDPDYSNAHYNLALLYDIYLQELALAIEHYSRHLALQEEPDPALQDWVKYLRNTLKNG